MNDTPAQHEYLLLSRGQWDPTLPPETIQRAIDQFYDWHGRLVAEGKMQAGYRLAREGKLVSRGAILDGPFTEAKEIIGGYWFINAGSLEEAAKLAADSPCLACGLSYEIRPLERERCSATALTSETPTPRGG